MTRPFLALLLLVTFATLAFAQSPPSAITLSGNTSGSAPTASTGAEGNYFLDAGSGFLFGPKTSGAWPTSGKSLQNSINITSFPYGASATASDNATALQSAINAAVAANVPLYIPAPSSGCYKYTAPLTISGNLSIIGDWVAGNWNNNINVPTGTPPIVGSVLCPSSNGSNAINVVVAGLTINVSNIGILFQTPFSGTGDGFHYIATGVGQGLSGAYWNNVVVYGHDGNHYAYNWQNAIYGQFNFLQSYGGGGLNLYGNSPSGNYGNQVFDEFYSQVVTGGSANGVQLVASQAQALNLITFIRPQVIVEGSSGVSSGNPPTSSQSIWVEDQNVRNIRKIGVDWETSVASSLTLGAAGYGNVSDFEGGFTDALNINAAAWGVNGILMQYPTRYVNDTTSSGAGVNTAMFAFPGTHITASSATTYPIMTTLYVGPPICATNTTCTRLDAIYANGEIYASGDLTTAGGMFITGNSQINHNAGNTTQIGDGTTSGAVTIGGASNLVTFGGETVAGGSPPTATGTCAINNQLGGNTGGSFKANGACAAGTVILTFTKAVTNGFACEAHDLTTPADTLNPTAYSTTSITFTGTMASSDLVTFNCTGF